MGSISIENTVTAIGRFLEYIFLGKGLTYYSGLLGMVFGTWSFFFAEKSIRRGIAEGHPSNNVRLIPWFRWGGLVFAVLGLAFIVLELAGFFDWLNTL